MTDNLYKLQARRGVETAFPGKVDEFSTAKAISVAQQEREASVQDVLPDILPEPVRDVVVDLGSGVVEQADLATRAFRSNTVAGAIIGAVDDYADDPADLFGFEEVDPSYNPTDHFEELTQGIPSNQWDNILDEGNLDSAKLERARILAEIDDQRVLGRAGANGATWALLSGFVDIDAPLAFLSSGTYSAAKLARLAHVSKLSQTGRGALKAGASVGVLETARYGLQETASWTDIPMAAFFGMGIGGAVSARQATRLSSNLDASIKAAEDDFVHGVGNDSVGAARNPDRPMLADDVLDGTQEEVINNARLWKEKSSFKSAWDSSWDSADPRVKAVRDRLVGFLDKHPKISEWYRTDYERLMASGSSVAQKFAYDFFESPTGIVRNNRSAAMLENAYQNRILGKSLPGFNHGYKMWARNKGLNLKETHWDDTHLHEYGQEVMLEMNHRRLHEGSSRPNVDPHVKEAADSLQEAADEALSIAKGRNGERAIDGMENVDGVGYTPMHWLSNRFSKAIHGGTRKDDLEELFFQGYKNVFDGRITDADLRTFAKAMVNRQLAKSDGMDESLVTMLTADGRSRMLEMLQASKVRKDDAERIVQALSGKLEEKGKAGFAKRRLEIDLSVEHNGLRLVDFVDTNMNRSWSLYGRQVAGRAALARKGITNNIKKTELIETILKEKRALFAAEAREAGRDGPSITPRHEEDLEEFRRFLEESFTYFEPGPIGKGVSDPVRRAKQFTNLVLLNQLGLTQMAETGALIAASGWENFVASSPIMQKILKTRGSNVEGILDELSVFGGRIGEEHHLIRDDLALDMYKTDTLTQHEFAQGLDKTLGKLQRLQGYTSGFYKVRAMQQKIAVASMANKVARMVRDGVVEQGGKRLEDIGLSGRTLDRVKTNILKYAEFTENGHLDRLNMAKWPTVVSEDFAIAMNRHTHQVVQKGMAGEGHVWMHSDMFALLTHLKNFPLLAMRKQTARNLRIMDQAALQTFTYGMATAGAVFTARQVINGRTENLEPEKIITGAFSLSNMTGFIPMLADPVASMLGMDDMRFNRYGYTTDLLNMPVLDTLNKTAKIPGHILDGEFGDAMKATPIMGNAYGFKQIWD